MNRTFNDKAQRVSNCLFQLMTLVVFIFLTAGSADLQARINITELRSHSEIKAKVKETLEGAGVTISNVQIEQIASYSQVGTFRNGTENYTPNIGISEGLVISSGRTRTLDDEYKGKYGYSFGNRFGKDNDLARLLQQKRPRQNDPLIITFDIVPSTRNISIDFVFGSDEYEEWVDDRRYIDAYGFFISGPSIQGDFENQAVNLATLDNGNPVSTWYINHEDNSDYYISNKGHRGRHVAVDGFTRVINGSISVTAGELYHVKIALGEKGDGQYDSSVFVSQFKSQRLFSGRLFHHRLGGINEDLLVKGDGQAFDYFSNARVVLFDANNKKVDETLTGPRGEYRFSVKDEARYQIAVDAATLKPVNDDDVYYPEQTWSSSGGWCIGDNYGSVKLTAAGYCYGGKTGGQRDELASQNTPESAEHLIEVPAGLNDFTDVNFGFSFDVVTQPGDIGQGSFRNFIANTNAGAGTGQMLFVPAVRPNSGRTWKADLRTPLPEIERNQLTIDGRAFSLTNPAEPVNPDPQRIKDGLKAGADQKPLSFWQAPDLHLETLVSQEALLQLEGSHQIVRHIALTNGSGSTGNMIGISVSSDCNAGCSVVDTVIGRNSLGSPSGKPFYRGIAALYGSDLTATHNWIYGTVDSGIVTAGSGTFSTNFLDDNAAHNNNSDSRAAAFALPGSAGNRSLILDSNYIQKANGYVIDAGELENPGLLKITGNTLTQGGLHSHNNNGDAGGLFVQVIDEVGHRVDISGNRVDSNRGPGVVIRSNNNGRNQARGNRISRNHFVANQSMPIDLVTHHNRPPDGPNHATGEYDDKKPNRGIDAPYINSVRQESGALVVEGFAMPKVKLEFYSVRNNEYRFLFERIEGSNDDKDSGRATYIDPIHGSQLIEQEQFKFTIPNVQLTGSLAAIAIDTQGNTSEFSVGTAGSVPGTVKTEVWQDLNRDGLRQTNEAGFKGVHVALIKLDETSGLPVLERESETDANGLLAFADVLPGDYQVEVLSDQPELSDWQLGATMSNPVKLSVEAGQESAVMFGYVPGTPEFTLTPDYQRAVAPGLTTRFTHTLLSSIAGNVQLRYRWLDRSGQPLTLNWPVKLLEANCDQALQDNLQSLQSTELKLDLEANIAACFDASVFIPAETPSGFRATLEITAFFTKVPTEVLAEQRQEAVISQRVSDTITVMTGSSGRLILNKQVQNISDDNGSQTNNQASPGDRLRYTLLFSNPGAGPIESLTLRDSTPPFTSLAGEALCPEALRETCSVSTVDNQRTYKGYRGDIIWRFKEKLSPGASGSVSYDVIIE